MNKQSYRIIFNKSRACLMVVAESAAAQGKGAAGERAGGGAAVCSLTQLLSTLGFVSKLLTGSLLVWLPLTSGMHAQAYAQTVATRIVADPSAPKVQQATVLNTANGLVQVNIQTPSAAGVSRNTFSQFDVGNAGAVVNNSRVNVQSQLGGWVQANPWLATGTARVILNEVKSSNSSYLQGYVELAGDRAAFVLANPSGIAINGAGFINASQVTLTTGTPNVNAGSLDSYRVQGGVISVDGSGLDARDADYTAILSRAVQVNAGIWAKQLQVITGSNDIQASSLAPDSVSQYTRIAALGAAPTYALDVAALGGMYAGKIYLIGTEAGLGVNNAGMIQASQGTLTLSHDGWLSNSGTLQASTQLQINTTAALTNSAVIYAGDTLKITSAGSQTHSGITAALGQVQLQAQGQIQSPREGLIAAGMQPDGKLVSGQDLSIDASNRLQLSGQTVSTHHLSLSGTGIDLSQGQVSAVQAQIQASSEDLIASQSRINVAQTLQLNTPQTLRSDGARIQAQTLQLQAQNLSNLGGQMAQQGTSDLSIVFAGQLDNRGGTFQTNSTTLNLQAQRIDNSSGQILHAGSGQLNIQVDTLTNAIQTGAPANSAGEISTNGKLGIHSQDLSNAGAIYAAGDSRIITDSFTNSGRFYASGQQTVVVTGTLTNSGTLAAQSHTKVQAGQLNSTSSSLLAAGLQDNGTFAALGDLQVSTSQSLKAGGQNTAAGSLSLQGQSLDLQGSQTITQHGSMQLLANVLGGSGDILTSRGLVSSSADLDIQGKRLTNTQGTLQAAQNLFLNVTDLDNTQGQIHANQNSTLQIQNGLINSGTISTNRDLSTSAAMLTNSGTLYAGGNQSLTVGNALSNSGTIAAAKDLSISAGSLSGTSANVLAAGMADNGHLTGTGTLTATTTGALQNAGQVLATNNMSLAGSSLNLSGSTTGTTAGDMALSASTGDINTSYAQVSTPGHLSISASNNTSQSLNNTGGAISAQTLHLQLANLNNTQGQFVQTGTADLRIDLHGGQLNNSNGYIGANALNFSLTSGGLNNTGGAIQHAGTGALAITAISLNNTQGQIIGNGAATLATAGNVTNADGLISASKDLSITSADLSNTRSAAVQTATGIQSQTGNVTLNAAALTNTGSIYAAKDLITTATSVGNSASIYSGGRQTLTVANDISNSGTIGAGSHLNLQAESYSATASSVTAAGMAANGQLSGTGKLTANTTGALLSAGQVLATNGMSLAGASLNLAGSQTGTTSGGMTMSASIGDISTSHAQISTPGQLSISANSNTSQSLNNTGGAISAQTLHLQLANLNNTQGLLVQTGTADLQIDLHGGQLNNSRGYIGANALNLGLRSGALDNTGGVIEHAGSGNLQLNASSLSNNQGQIIGNGQVTANISGRVINADGLISASKDLSITSADISNTSSGTLQTASGIQSQTGNVTLNVAALSNTGSIYAAVDLSTVAISISNSASLYAAGQQTLTVTNAITNSGTIAAAKDLSISAGSFSGTNANVLAAGMASDGKLSGTGALNVNALGAFQSSGQVLATGHVQLAAASLDLSAATVGSTGTSTAASGNVSLIASSGDVTTKLAQISSPGQLTIIANNSATQKLDNSSGQLSAMQLSVDVGQLVNDHGRIEQTGAGVHTASIQTAGVLNNTSGSIIANAQDATLTVGGALTNTNGLIGHAGTGAFNMASSSLDNSQGQIIGNGQITARINGNVTNSDGLITASKDLSITSANLSNTRSAAVQTATGIQSQTGNVTLNAAALTNTGSIYAAKDLITTATSVGNSASIYSGGRQTLTVANDISNSGTIGAGSHLNLQAESYSATASSVTAAGMAENGELTGTGKLRATTTGALQSTGQVLATNGMSLAGASLNLAGSQTGTTAGDVALSASSGDINTSHAQISTPGLLSISAVANPQQTLDNTSGQISGKQLSFDVGQLVNDHGVIEQTGTGVQTARIQTAAALNNTSGSITLNAQDSVVNAGGALTNTSGFIAHAGVGTLSLNAGSLNNTQGQIVGNGQITAHISGNVTNADGLISASKDLSITSADFSNTRSGAVQTVTGLQSLSGNVTLNAAALTNTGSMYAAKDLSTTATSLGNSASLYAGGSQSLTVSNDINNNGTIAAAQDLNIQAGSFSGTSANVLAAGMASNGQLTGTGTLTANTSGALQSAGQVLATAGMSVSGASLNLANSTTGTTAGNVSLSASSGDINTSHAQVSTPGLLSISASQMLDNTQGLLNADQLFITAGQLNNAQGQIVQTGQGAGKQARIQTSGQLGNNGGYIGANAHDLSLSSGHLSNAGGTIQHAGTGHLQLTASSIDNSQAQIIGNGQVSAQVGGSISNNHGQWSSQADLQIQSGSLDNTAGRITSAQNASVTTQNLQNTQGLLAATQGLTLSASAIDNQSGTLAAVQGDLILSSTGGGLDNRSGSIQAGRDLKISLQGSGNTLKNAAGQIKALRDLSASTGVLDNTQGLMLATRNLSINTQSQNLINRQTHNGQGNMGLLAGGTATITAGNMDNQGGLIHAQGLTVQALALDNRALPASGAQALQTGLIYSGADMALTVNSLDNRGSQLLAVGNMNVQAGTGVVDNTASLIKAEQDLTLNAGTVLNSQTLGTPNRGIEANNITVSANTINNQQGAMRAANNLTLASDGQLDNTSGLLSAVGTLSVRRQLASAATLRLTNTNAQMVADRAIDIRAGSLVGEGQIQTLGNLSLNLQGDYTTQGTLRAGGDFQFQITGHFTNAQNLSAGRALTITAQDIDNTVDGQMVGQSTTVNAAGTFTNRGLVDGADVSIQAATVYNAGTGRLYGDRLSAVAGSLSNQEETLAGVTTAATIAARQQLTLGVQNLTNREHALIYSAGDMVIGQGQSLSNISATIEAAGNLTIHMGNVLNSNAHFATAEQAMPDQVVVQYQGQGSSTRYLPGDPGVSIFNDQSDHLRTPEGDFETWTQYEFTRQTTQTVVTATDPGKIYAGGSLSLTGGSLTNDKSRIVAGGALTVQMASVDNIQGTGTRTTTDTGTATSVWRKHRKGTDTTGYTPGDYGPVEAVQTISLKAAAYEGNASPGGTGSAPGASTAQGVNLQSSATGSINRSNAAAAIITVNAATSTAGTAQGTSTSGQAQTGAATGQTVAAGTAQGTTTMGQAQAGAAAGQTVTAGTAQGFTTTGQAQAGAATGQTVTAGTAQGATTTGQAQTGAATGQTLAAGTAQGTHAPNATGSKVNTSATTASGTTTAPGTRPAGQVRTLAQAQNIPGASIYRTHPEPGTKYLVETDPQFAGYKNWLGSDYMITALSLNPATTQKRLGDGFYEQKLIREQVVALTGQRFLGDYQSDEQEYQGLMNNGLTYARQWNLRPGIALSAEQMAQLTTDMVWLVTQDVTLADGSVQSVLVPQVYVRVKEGDLDGSGALLAGSSVNMNLTGDLTNNGGTIAGRNVMSLTAQNIHNLAGTLTADTLTASARQDLNNIAGEISGVSGATATAGRDLNITSTTQSSATPASASRNGLNSYSQTGVDRVAGLYVKGNAGALLASAGRDMNLTGAVIANAGTGGTTITAGRDLNLNTLTTASSQTLVWDANNRLSQSQSQDVGSQISAGGSLSLAAGQDLNAKAAQVNAAGSLTANAMQSINITAGQASQSLDEAHQTTSKGFLSSKTRTSQLSNASTTALASTFEGQSVSIGAGQDLSVKGSNILADQSVALTAGRGVSIEAAQNTSTSSSFNQTQRSGLMSGGGLSVTYGKQSQSLDQQNQQTTAAASTVGSIGGNVNITAGQTFTQTGSDVLTPGRNSPSGSGDINITAKTVNITEARETGSQSTEQRFRQSGLTVAITSPAISALQTANSQIQAAGNTSSSRMQALAAANVGFNLKQGAAQVQDAISKGEATGGAGISVSLGSSSSQSNSQSSADNARGSSVNAGGNVTIQATRTAGAPNDTGKDSDITIQGSNVQAGKATTLKADDQVNLLAAQNTTSERSSNQSKSGSIGLAFSAQGTGVTASAARATGQGAGNSTTYTNTQVAGNTVSIDSGSDTTLQGAVVQGNQVTATVGGNLNIQSLQDTSQYKESSKSAGGSVMVGITNSGPVSGNVNLGRTSINSTFTSVNEQSAIRAGDGGFNVNVAGKTDLVGGQITSTQAAVDAGKNTFSSAGGVQTQDLQNSASFSANSVSVGLGTGRPAPGQSLSAGLSGVGIGSDKGSASSVSTAGISGVAGNQQARTGDKETGIGQIFDKDKVRSEVAAQVAITGEFGKHASKIGGTEADKLRDALKTQADSEPDLGKKAALQAESAKWDEGGAYRVAMHAVIGGLTGGAAGAVGAGAASAAAPVLDQLQGQLQQGLQNAGLGKDASTLVASLASGATAAGIGAAASGGSVAGGAMAFNADMNNRQLHPREKALLKIKAADFADKLKKDGYSAMTEERALAILTEQADNRVDETQAKRLDTITMDDSLKTQARKYLNEIGGSAGTYDDGRGNQIRYFTNTTASGDRRIEDFKNPNINAEPHVPAVDYVTVQGGGLGLGVATTVNLHNGEVFVGGSKSNISTGAGASVTLGRMLDAPPKDTERGEAVSNMLGGASAQTAVCAGGICAGLNQSIGKPGQRPTAVEIGIGTPGVSSGVGVSLPVSGTKK